MAMPKIDVKNIIAVWPEATREIAQNIIQEYGDPEESTPSMLVWYNNGPWKKTVVYRHGWKHSFPIPHTDAVEQTINYNVALDKYCEIAYFDGSVTVNRTKGEMSACCHDEEANFLALNLTYDIIRNNKSVDQARRSYTENMIAYRKGEPTPYMNKLQFTTGILTSDPDESTISQQELAQASASRR